MLKRGPRVVISKEFVSQDGTVKIPVALRKLSQLEIVSALDIANEKFIEIVTGVGEPGDKGYQPPRPLPPINGEPVFLSLTSCQVAAIIWRAQTCENDRDRYSFEEMAQFMIDDAILEQMSETVEQLREVPKKSDDPLANSGQTSSSMPFTEEQQTTPALSLSSATASGPSTSDSAEETA